VHKIAILSDELENVKQLNFSLQKLEGDNIEPKISTPFGSNFILEVASIDH
jgi:hypothetical protein